MRTRSNVNDRLRQLPMFRGCSSRDLTVVARYLDRVEVPEGKVLVREGRHGVECFVIDEGTVSVTRGGDEVAMLGPGDVLGELALLSGGPRDATATTVTPTAVYVLHQPAFHGLLAEVASVRDHLFQVLAGRLRDVEAPVTVAAHS